MCSIVAYLILCWLMSVCVVVWVVEWGSCGELSVVRVVWGGVCNEVCVVGCVL